MAEIRESLLWDVKYRPKSFDEYVSSNDQFVGKAKEYIKEGSIPHLLLWGPPGVGKSLAAELLVNYIDCDLLRINASDENNVETIRTKIKNFVTTISVGNKLKIVLLEEGDHISMQAQGILRDILEKYIEHSRFILTCNYYDKIIPAIKSRFSKGTFEIKSPSKPEIAKFVTNILEKEKITYDINDVVKIINNEYPDIRSILGTLQVNILNKKLTLNESTLIEADYMNKILSIMQDKKIKKYDAYVEIRKIISGSRVSNFQPFIDFLFKNIDSISEQIELKAGIILILAEAQVQDSFSINKELNIIAAIIKILGEIK